MRRVPPAVAAGDEERWQARWGGDSLDEPAEVILLILRAPVGLEVAQQQVGCDPRMAARILPGDQQRQLERVDQTELREFASCGERTTTLRRCSARLKIP